MPIMADILNEKSSHHAGARILLQSEIIQVEDLDRFIPAGGKQQ